MNFTKKQGGHVLTTKFDTLVEFELHLNSNLNSEIPAEILTL